MTPRVPQRQVRVLALSGAKFRDIASELHMTRRATRAALYRLRLKGVPVPSFGKPPAPPDSKIFGVGFRLTNREILAIQAEARALDVSVARFVRAILLTVVREHLVESVLDGECP